MQKFVTIVKGRFLGENAALPESLSETAQRVDPTACRRLKA